MSTYNALAIAGKFNYAAMPESIQQLVRNIFNPCHLSGLIGHWEEDKRIALARGIAKEDYARFDARHICEWEWHGNNHWKQTLEHGLELRHITTAKVSYLGLRSLVSILAPYIETTEVFAVIGSLFNDEGNIVEKFWVEDGTLLVEQVDATDYYSCSPFDRAELWMKEKDMLCLTSTLD